MKTKVKPGVASGTSFATRETCEGENPNPPSGTLTADIKSDPYYRSLISYRFVWGLAVEYRDSVCQVSQ